jgi:peptide/nickel transport system ATP-binding protein
MRSIRGIAPRRESRVSDPLLQVAGLEVAFATRGGRVTALRGLDADLRAGEILGVVGESGSGKTQLALAVMGLLATNGTVSGSIRFDGRELVGLPAKDHADLRGSRLGMVFQDPMTALNPHLRIGVQMGLAFRRHRGGSARAARDACAAMLAAVQVTDPGRRLDMYPHELSGGMRQRVLIATALLCRPALLIADEPTTALDVTVQAEILRLFSALRRDFGTAILFISHDLGVVAGLCDRVLVLRQGELVESGPTSQVLSQPQADYTRQLLAAVPRLNDPGPRPAPAGPPVLAVADLQVRFRLPRPALWQPAPVLTAVGGADFELRAGETLGIVGESGSGKSTLVRAALRLIPPTAGRVLLLGRSLDQLGASELRTLRRNAQFVFQDPFAALDPRLTVRDIVAEPLTLAEPGLSAAAIDARVTAALVAVRLEAAMLHRYPHEFSGGQCQRIGIARALVVNPAILVCDEPVSALDVTVQAEVVRLLRESQESRGLAMVFIAHDLAVVRALAHRVLVMYLGRIVESGPAASLYDQPLHPYTRLLLAAVPRPEPGVRQFDAVPAAPGELPSPLAPPSGCVFRTRCALAVARCASEVPVLRPLAGRDVACHRADDPGARAA